MKNIMVIINPTAGKSNGISVEDTLKEQLGQYFENVIVEETKDSGHATELAKKACEENFFAVASVGGDGTLAEVINGLIEYENPPHLLIMPAGTGNILSKSFNINQDILKVVEETDFSNTKNINIGMANDKAFSFLLSIGNIPEAVNSVSSEDKEKFGMFSYIVNVAKNINKETDHLFRVKVDDEIYEGEVDHVLVLLYNKFGYIQLKEIETDGNDGNLHVFILKDNSLFEKARLGINLLLNNVTENENVIYMTGKTARIESLNSENINVDLDGDIGPEIPVEIKTINDRISVFLPKKFKEE